MTQRATAPERELVKRASLTESERHRLLASESRRVVLSVLADASTPVSLEDLATAVAAEESAPSKLASQSAARLVLHHQHLPKLSHLEIIDYDPTKRQVTL